MNGPGIDDGRQNAAGGSIRRHLQHDPSRNPFRAFAKPIGHGQVAQLIDQPGKSSAELRHRGTRVFRKEIGVAPSNRQSMAHVGPHVGLAERLQGIIHGDALRELTHVVAGQHGTETRLPRQHDLQADLATVVEVGQEPEILQHLKIEILSLIDDQQNLPPRGEGLVEK